MGIVNFFNNTISPRYQPSIPLNKAVSPENNQSAGKKSGSASDEAVRLTLSPEAKKYLEKLAAGEEQTDAVNAKNGKFPAGNGEKNTKLDSQTLAQDSQPTSENKLNLSEEELRTIQKMKIQDLYVKMHEQQHMAVAGAYAIGGPHYQFVTGPDGKSYAVGGEVQLDTSPVPNNPEATIRKAQIIRQGALAPADPSGADRAVAAAATQMEAKARQELAEKTDQQNYTAGNLPKNEFAKQRDLKIRVYTYFTRPNQTGQLFNQSA